MENKLRKHLKQMSAVEIEFVESLVHGVKGWKTGIARGHAAKRGREFTETIILHAIQCGEVIEVNSLGRVLMRDGYGICVLVSIKDHVAFTVWANDPKDNHDSQHMGYYNWHVDVIKYLRGL